MREDLASMGEPLIENNFYAIIMGSLPPSYDPYISALNTTSSVMGKQPSANDLMLSITEEYERCALKIRGSKKDDNAAFYSNDTDKGKRGGSSSKKDKECHNCHKKRHFKADCWAKGGRKEGQGPKQKGKGKEKESAAAAQEKKEEKKEDKPKDEEAWMTIATDDTLKWDSLEYTSYDNFSVCEEAYSCFMHKDHGFSPCTTLLDTLNVFDKTSNHEDVAHTTFEAAYLTRICNTEVDLVGVTCLV